MSTIERHEDAALTLYASCGSAWYAWLSSTRSIAAVLERSQRSKLRISGNSSRDFTRSALRFGTYRRS